jgi:predicted nuclease of restriction endonuclease-like (RecB) superfamily
VTPEEAIKDRFVLEFLDKYSESDLEEALIQRLGWPTQLLFLGQFAPFALN